MKTVVVAGFYRTGSTWLFNAVKHTLIQSGFKVAQSGNAVSPAPHYDYCVHKVHKLDQGLLYKADTIFTSMRDLDDALKSFNRFTGYPMSPEFFEDAFKQFTKYNERSAYCMDYNDLLNHKRKVIVDIAKVLNVKVDPTIVLKRLEAIKPPKKGWDSSSFYWRGHIGLN